MVGCWSTIAAIQIMDAMMTIDANTANARVATDPSSLSNLISIPVIFGNH